MLVQTLKKSFVAAMLLAVLSGASVATAATIVDTTYVASGGFVSGNADYFLDGATATWTINPGVTISEASSRFFIEINGGSTGAEFIVDGGGTMTNGTSNACCGTRLGQSPGNGVGTLTISGGSTFRMTNAAGVFGGSGDGGFLNLNDVGSTFSAGGTYDANTGLFTGVGTLVAVPVSVSGGALSVTDLGGGITQLSVVPTVPEPSTFVLAALGMMGLCVRRRRRR